MKEYSPLMIVGNNLRNYIFETQMSLLIFSNVEICFLVMIKTCLVFWMREVKMPGVK